MPSLSFIDSKTLTIICYFIAAIAQLIAAVVAFSQIKKVTAYRSGWSLLALGLALMLSRRIIPLSELFQSAQYSSADAQLSLLISLLLMFGVLQVRKLFHYMQQQEQKLEQLAKYDFLTGALSRFAIVDQGILEVERTLRFNRPITILIIDIDKFKNINDSYGHAEGDEVLVALVHVCKNSLRHIDLFGRFGGDEFLAILPETSMEMATQIAARLKTEVASSHFKIKQDELKITVSIGIGCFDPRFKSVDIPSTAKELLDYLIRKADLKMYQSKQVENPINSTGSNILTV